MQELNNLVANNTVELLDKALLDVVARPETNDITVRQLCVILSLAKGSRTIRDIADEVPLTKAAISRAADWMERIGFAKRYEDLEDRRSVLLMLTPAGKRFLDSLSAAKA